MSFRFSCFSLEMEVIFSISSSDFFVEGPLFILFKDPVLSNGMVFA